MGIFRLEIAQGGCFGRGQCFVKAAVLLLRHGTVDVIAIVLLPFVIAGFAKGDGHINAVGRHNGGEGIVKVEIVAARKTADVLRQRGRSERPSGNNGGHIGHAGHFFAHHLNVGVLMDTAGDEFGKSFAVYGEGGASGHGRGCGALEDKRAKAAHFRLEQARRFGNAYRAQRVATDQFSQFVGDMSRGIALGAHLEKAHMQAVLGRLPCRLGSRQSAANDQ